MNDELQATRNDIRKSIFAAKNRLSETVEFLGAQIEIRQPTLGDALDYQQEEDRKIGMAKILISYCYLPDTDVRVFEEADTDMILGLPFGADMVRVNRAINKLTGLDEDAEDAALKELAEAPLESKS